MLEQLATPQLSVQVMSERIGDASALKICDAVMAKGLTAMMLQMLVEVVHIFLQRLMLFPLITLRVHLQIM